jgi:AraC-like DNA-binding protein
MLIKSYAYITGVEIHNVDYSFAFPVSSPPPTLIDNREYHFHRGRMIVFLPGSSVTTKATMPTQGYITLFFKQEYFENILMQMGSQTQLSFNYSEYPYTSRLYSMVHSLYEEMSGDPEERSSLILQSMTILIAAEILRQTDACDRLDKTGPRLQAHYVEDAIEYISTNFRSDIKIEDISSFIHLSPYHFIRIFKQHTGLTPHEYLLKTRLEHAQNLLTSDTCSINEAARECGFINTSHFTACFRRNQGLSPKEFRGRQI